MHFGTLVLCIKPTSSLTILQIPYLLYEIKYARLLHEWFQGQTSKIWRLQSSGIHWAACMEFLLDPPNLRGKALSTATM